MSRDRLADGTPIQPAEFADAFACLGDRGSILVAVSGGPDSIAILHALARWSAESSGAPLAVATVDHGLRPGSRAEAEGVAAAARALGLHHTILTWSERRAGSVSQDAARQARYHLLAAHADEIGATCLVTAHTLDDQAETVLMRMAAGTGIAGIAAMSAASRRGAIVHARPLLRFAKARLVATCRAEGWSFVDDPTNRDTRYARPRWRDLMPALAAEGLGASRLARLAERAARADAALAHAARAAFARSSRSLGGQVLLDADALAREPAEIALRVLALALPTAVAAPSLRLERLETYLDALLAARSAGRSLRRTLVGRLLHLDRAGTLAIGPEPARQRGRVPSPARQDDAEPHIRPRA